VQIQVLQRAFAVLDVLAIREAGLAELAAAAGLQKTTLHNILKTLVELGAVRRTPGGGYALGPKLVELAEREFRRISLQPLAQRIADDLAAELRETVVISTLRGVERFIVGFALGPQELTVRLDVTTRRSPFDASTGRVLLAYLSEQELDRVVEHWGMPGELWREVTDRTSLDAALAEIRRTGLALHRHSQGEFQTVAAPVPGPDRRPWAAIGIRMPASRFQNGQREQVIDGLRRACGRMSDLLGFQGPVAQGNDIGL
jgi:DNA-binding IclR family transcriptional regulator